MVKHMAKSILTAGLAVLIAFTCASAVVRVDHYCIESAKQDSETSNSDDLSSDDIKALEDFVGAIYLDGQVIATGFLVHGLGMVTAGHVSDAVKDQPVTFKSMKWVSSKYEYDKNGDWAVFVLASGKDINVGFNLTNCGDVSGVVWCFGYPNGCQSLSVGTILHDSSDDFFEIGNYYGCPGESGSPVLKWNHGWTICGIHVMGRRTMAGTRLPQSYFTKIAVMQAALEP